MTRRLQDISETNRVVPNKKKKEIMCFSLIFIDGVCASQEGDTVFVYCLLDNGCQDVLLFSIGRVEMLSIFGSLHKLSVGLSALKQNLKHSSSAKGRCNRSHYANACFVCCRAVKTNTHKHTQVLRVYLAAGLKE